MPEDEVSQPHDRFFKQVFGRRQTAAAFFQAYLPVELAAAVDWTSLELVSGSFVDAALRNRQSDLLYRARMQETTVFLYCLFEHQRQVDAWMPLRLLGYMLRIWDEALRAQPKAIRLPPIIPLVLYQGAQRWSAPAQFFDLIEAPAALREALRLYQPCFEHLLLDLSRFSATEIRGDVAGRLGLSLMKAVAEDRLVQWIEEYGSLLHEVMQAQDVTRLFEVLLRYLFAADTQMDYETTLRAIERAATSTTRENIMSIEQYLIEKGRQEGEQLGEHKGELIGTIQTLQQVLGLPVSDRAELARKQPGELEPIAESLRARLAGSRG